MTICLAFISNSRYLTKDDVEISPDLPTGRQVVGSTACDGKRENGLQESPSHLLPKRNSATSDDYCGGYFYNDVKAYL